MILTSDYRNILAIFDSPVKYTRDLAESFHPGSGFYDVGFTVGPFEYTISIAETRNPGIYTVTFSLVDIHYKTQQELFDLITKMVGKGPLSNFQVDYYYKHLDKFGIYNTGNINQVMTHVMQAVVSFVHKYRPKALRFDSHHKSRTKMYRTLLRRYFSSYETSEQPHPDYNSFFIYFENENDGITYLED